MDYVISILPQMWEGTLETIRLFAITIVLSIPLGVLLALGRVSGFKALRDIIGVYVWLLRGTPLMLQLIFVYFAPFYLFGMPLGNYRFPATIIAFSINYSCYFAEIYRGGLESIPVGQHEAAEVLGFSKRQTFFRIVLPQVLKRIVPPMGNEVITLVKDTALAQTIAIMELFRVAQAAAASRTSLVPLVMAGVFYLVASFLITRAFNWAERKMSYYH